MRRACRDDIYLAAAKILPLPAIGGKPASVNVAGNAATSRTLPNVYSGLEMADYPSLGPEILAGRAREQPRSLRDRE
jgi:hypothetical protein